MFTITGFHRSTEQDDYENGCIGNCSDNFYDLRLQNATISGLLEKIAHHHGCTVPMLELDACDELGRVEFGRTENVEGYEASESELASWREGNTILFYAVETCYIMQCKPVSAL
jgi:hypothetical protein